ncbi:MAG TPA: AraC family transcriptional regulator, partial [Candidatus Synoicihabitans sp.]|nr:AraC family transcriptional regulator [Candidatus Synoicihabitans sp.]
MAELIGALAQGQGFSASRLPGVKFMRSTSYVPPSPVAYEPSIVLIAQGRKRGVLAGRVYPYDANYYLVLTLPVPFECETFGA